MKDDVDQCIIEHLINTGEDTINKIIKFSISYFAYINEYEEIEYELPKFEFVELINTRAGEYHNEENVLYVNKNTISLESFAMVIVHESIHAAQYIYDPCIEELLTINDQIYYYDSLIEQEARILTDSIKPIVISHFLLPYYEEFYNMVIRTINENFKEIYNKEVPSIINDTIKYVSNLTEIDYTNANYGDMYKQIKMFYNTSQVLMSIDSAYNSIFNISNFINKRLLKI